MSSTANQGLGPLLFVSSGAVGVDAREAMAESVVSGTFLRRAANLKDVGNVAVFAASNHARAITAMKLNITCGAEVD